MPSSSTSQKNQLPKISLAGLTPSIVHHQSHLPQVKQTAELIVETCATVGFFYICDFEHLIPDAVFNSLDKSARTFFNLPDDIKMKIDMNKGGKAWRGSFPLGNESTSGKPDLKEGIYFGTELTTDDADAENTSNNNKLHQLPLHGRNQFPDEDVPEMRKAVLLYMKGCKRIGHTLLGLISLGLQLPSPDYIYKSYTRQPLELFRIFHYPPRAKTIDNPKFAKSDAGVQAHCDYGLLTLLRANDLSGLQVQDQNDPNKWIDVQHVEKAMVVNIGDMLEGITHGLLKSTLHRVAQPQNPNSMRISFPYFFDPGFETTLTSLPLNEDILRRAKEARDRRERNGFKRWDKGGSTLSLAETGNVKYGDYVLSKVAKCFPKLFENVVVSKL